ncbi:unnamed protein product [Paramecium sonneborni]|uniref:Transmembrane amino acid transporter protein n=1 Tax=Paramecium sonneborni TaxID=65129 RepID=A0A8S1NXP1_9CILI|nr:unnamed protein product [Paramecium sonneborni]
MKKKNSSSSDMLEHSAGDISSPMLSPRKRKQKGNETFNFMLRVINSSFVFSTLTLPFYFQMVGIIFGVITCIFFFILSYFQSLLLLDLKYYARSKKKQGSLTKLFELLQMPKYSADIYRGIMIFNAYLYIVLLMSVFQSSIQSLIYMMAKQQLTDQWAKSLASQQFIQFIGSLLMIPFFVKWKYPVYIVAIARILGVLSIIFIIIASFDISHPSSQYLYPSSEKIVQSLISTPTILLAFAYHSQFFTARASDKGLENDDDLERKLKKGALFGSLFLMCVEVTFSILAAIAFNSVNTQLDSLYGNLIRMVYQSKNFDPHLSDAYFYIFYIFIAISAQLQLLQYIPYITVLVLNIWDKKPVIPKEQNVEFILITDGDFHKEEEKDNKKSQTMNYKFKQSFAIHENTKLQQNQNTSIFVTVVFYILAFLFAMAKPPILLLSCLMGSTSQNFVTFLIPSILYLDKQFKIDADIYKKCFAWFTFIFSIIFAIVSVSFGLYGLYSDQI